MSHLTDDDRKTISNMLAHKATCIDIANKIGCDPTTIAKEIKKKESFLRKQKAIKRFFVRN